MKSFVSPRYTMKDLETIVHIAPRSIPKCAYDYITFKQAMWLYTCNADVRDYSNRRFGTDAAYFTQWKNRYILMRCVCGYLREYHSLEVSQASSREKTRSLVLSLI